MQKYDIWIFQKEKICGEMSMEQGWKYYNHALLPDKAPHESVQ